MKEEENTLKQGFFKKVWNSITKIEKYPDMAAEGLGRAFIYICKIVALLVIIICLGTTYQTYKILQEGITYLQNQFPEFSYKDGILEVNSEEKIIISEEDSYVGKTIIDTKTEEQKTINQYINEIEKSGDGLLILKDEVIVENQAVGGTISYNYKETLEKMGINQFTKQDLINYTKSSKMIQLYVSIFITIFIYSFLAYLITTLSNILFLSIFGYLTTLITRIKIRYIAIFNMSVYAHTLSIILNMIYIAVNIFINFNIEYFQVMYVSVAAIYLVAAIFLLRVELIKRQAELIKIAEAQEIVRKELEEKEEREKEEKEKQEKQEKEKKEKNEKEKKDDNNLGDEPEGSNA